MGETYFKRNFLSFLLLPSSLSSWCFMVIRNIPRVVFWESGAHHRMRSGNTSLPNAMHFGNCCNCIGLDFAQKGGGYNSLPRQFLLKLTNKTIPHGYLNSLFLFWSAFVYIRVIKFYAFGACIPFSVSNISSPQISSS